MPASRPWPGSARPSGPSCGAGSNLEKPLTELKANLAELRVLASQQDFHQAKKQEASKRIRELIGEGNKRSTLLKIGLQQHYGNRSEKLVEFGIQPLRTRRRAKPEAEPETPAVSPAVAPNGPKE
jgi:hypothetical protein